jgi:hypothetical protein
VSSLPRDQGSKPSKEPASNATQPSEATPEPKRGPLVIKITDEQAAGIF